MPRLSVPSMIAAARRFGLTVEVVPGAETRGASNFTPKVFVGHHTAGAKTGARPSLNLCVVGRSDLAGPLCNWFLDRNGVCVIVAAGVANHAGAGSFRGISGNLNAQGCEAEDDGDGNWADAQIIAYPKVVAAGLSLNVAGHRDASWYCSHRTWTPRKIDPAGISDPWMRERVNDLFSGKDDDVSYEDAVRAVRDVLSIQNKLNVPSGQKNNDNLAVNLTGMGQANVNTQNRITSGLTAVQGAIVKVQDAITLVHDDTELQGDDEANVLAELHNTESRLTALINPPTPS